MIYTRDKKLLDFLYLPLFDSTFLVSIEVGLLFIYSGQFLLSLNNKFEGVSQRWRFPASNFLSALKKSPKKRFALRTGRAHYGVVQIEPNFFAFTARVLPKCVSDWVLNLPSGYEQPDIPMSIGTVEKLFERSDSFCSQQKLHTVHPWT